ncbi:CTP--2,3-di-O-geranylgeranyl-sn-glycero-1-phosphate cytidyltransferase [Methanococcoides burtonii]|uniref:CTP:2, 3-di-O-geranylgeranyl-sn-glycero-1-phosphate cytidyltransferase n=1 Tax=Methanococcoides burtonii (strain DSM 6242 / NBRC 107633 / OCM 468 / ACE-M) TaxID=259564 RepID=Q12TG9_METBU|nr:CTP--2,3-di-O-geranylgeranyl-sn-glycero-1-phosphate cytidyltransferase [Methanococcoides burtonii]ABE53257.1 CTP:2,3-di-O-geranylgeranyl-sn-glycero-1-phosphate cytidyltransferase [Methanococcoides burtonii DSM 6242]
MQSNAQRSIFLKEFVRKSIHFISLSIVFIYYYMGKEFTLNFLTLVLCCILLIDYFRVEKNLKIPVVWKLYRAKEKDKLSGTTYFMIGSIIAISIFSKEVASAAILMTTFGDSAAALIGIRYGKRWIKNLPNRAWEGVISEFIVNLIIGYLFLSNWIVALTMALAATIIETLIYKLDDNLIIPLFSGLIGHLVLIAYTLL